MERWSQLEPNLLFIPPFHNLSSGLLSQRYVVNLGTHKSSKRV